MFPTTLHYANKPFSIIEYWKYIVGVKENWSQERTGFVTMDIKSECVESVSFLSRYMSTVISISTQMDFDVVVPLRLCVHRQ